MVSYTNTIESSHRIGVFAGYRKDDGSFKDHGFLLNNELTDFNTTPSTNPFTGGAGYNDVQPANRPRSSMVPTMIFMPNGDPFITYGSPGGSTIINSVLNVTLNLIDHKMTLQNAINAPRVSITSTGSARQRHRTCRAHPCGHRHRAGGPGLQRRLAGRHRLGAGGAGRSEERPAIRRRERAPRGHGNRLASMTS
jgi:gamma-glutamyltranspeptidase